jgi:hypothetical protein
MTQKFELTFEDFFLRFYDAGQEKKAMKIWEKMLEEGDDECEMKDYVWREVMYMVRWGSVLREVKEMARSVLSDEEESD